MSECKCKSCPHMKSFRKPGNRRSEYCCEHPNQRHILEWFKEKKIQKMVGFLAYGKGELPLKRTPKWCPIEAEGET